MSETRQKFDFEQMQKYFEDEAYNIRCISDYQLSVSDYKSLGAKLKTLMMQEPNYDWMQEFVLPLTIFITYSYIYDVPEMRRDLSYTDIAKRVPQYQLRQNAHNMLECIHDFGLLDFGYDKHNVLEACRMTIARHAGIPNDEKYEVIALIAKHQGILDAEPFMNAVYSELPPQTKRIVDILDMDSRYEILFSIRDLINSCTATASRRQVLEKFPNLSIALIDFCIFWCENQRMQERIGNCC